MMFGVGMIYCIRFLCVGFLVLTFLCMHFSKIIRTSLTRLIRIMQDKLLFSRGRETEVSVLFHIRLKYSL